MGKDVSGLLICRLWCVQECLTFFHHLGFDLPRQVHAIGYACHLGVVVCRARAICEWVCGVRRRIADITVSIRVTRRDSHGTLAHPAPRLGL